MTFQHLLVGVRVAVKLAGLSGLLVAGGLPGKWSEKTASGKGIKITLSRTRQIVNVTDPARTVASSQVQSAGW